MNARVARGGPARVTQARQPARKTVSRGPAKGGRKAPPPRPSFTRELAGAIGRGGAALILLALLVAGAVAAGLPQMVGMELGERIGLAGFSVKRVEPKGLRRLAPMRVYQIADQQLGRPMPLVDLEGTRAKLLELGWVRDARVSRRLPDTLVIDIVERTPTAIWQHDGQLALIDREGVVLEPVKLEAMPDLPVVIGPAANRQAGALAGLLGAAPELKPLMEGATWVGGRRWDIRFQSGEVLALPEGQEEAAKALVRFARMDRSNQLLGRGLVRFDMRLPGKLIVRVSSEPGDSVPAIAPPTPPAAPAAPGTAGPIDGTKTI